MPATKKKPKKVAGKNKAVAERQFKVSEGLKVKLHTGEVVDAKVRAVVPGKRGFKLQVDYGHDETVLIRPGQVVD